MSNPTTMAMPARVSWIRNWPHWAPYAAVAWALVYAFMGLYWAVSGRGFPYTSALADNALGPIATKFGPAVAWIIVVMLGIPAAIIGAVMLRGSRRFRPFLITAGVLLSAVPLLLMTDINLLILLGYTPYSIINLLRGAASGQIWLKGLAQWSVVHQLVCLIGGFLWLAATVSYARHSAGACLYCGRGDRLESWTSPSKAARWGRIAVYIAMIAPVFYALTRFAWAAGIPLGMTEEYLRNGQKEGTWISGLFLATFGLVGAALMLGLVQRWGEVFPSWMIGLARRRVPIALAVVPASIVSVLLMVGGLSILSSYNQMAGAATATAQDLGIVVGPTFLFPLWGAALAVATLGYYYRRRGPCAICGRGVAGENSNPFGRLTSTGQVQ